MSKNSNTDDDDDDDGSNGDKWSAQADLYSDQASRLTELHGADLVTLLKNDILKVKTILDIGCGTGAFAKAYIQQFPKGVPNQTLILSDLSAGMLEKAKETIQPTIMNYEFQTKILFQQEDGTKLDGITDQSIDIVVSLFGVFLIPDQERVQKAIKRVLKKKDGIFANGSWVFGISETLSNEGFGVSLQDAFQVPVKIVNPKFQLEEQSFYRWSDRYRAKTVLSDQYKLRNVQTFSALHTTVWEFEKLWTMMATNPMTGVETASEDVQQKAKEALEAFLTKDGSSSFLDQPLMLSAASILAVGRGAAATTTDNNY